MADTYKIFPSIGVARVGNSEEPNNYYYLAPETSGGLPIRPGTENTPITEHDLRDSKGNLKREGARFRVYCYPDGGGAPYEVKANSGSGIKIEWTVHLANKKAVAHEFKPMKGEGKYPPDNTLRNPNIKDRASLIIDPGPRTLIADGNEGSAPFSRNCNPKNYIMTFPPVGLKPFEINTLGEIRTDKNGRLIVIGSLGHSGTNQPYDPERSPDLDYANNNYWWDDTSDGPVSATVVLSNGTRIEADPAWVVVTPPAYAPEIVAQITMYDVMFDVAVRHLNYRPDIYKGGKYQDTYRVDKKELEDLMDRAYPYNWVGTEVTCHKFDWNDPNQPTRLYSWMRGPDKVNVRGEGSAVQVSRGLMPMLAGDGSQGGTIGTDQQSKYVSFTYTQMFLAKQWSEGKTNTEKIPPATEPDRLTRAALDGCSGGAFGPGIEMTWISRRPEIYMGAFRLKKRNYGPRLSTDPTPLADGLEPGDFTKYMALPWQADFNECSVQPIPQFDGQPRPDWEKLNWWPAQRMLMVYPKNSAVNYAWVGNPSTLRFSRNSEMVEKWSKLGFVLESKDSNHPGFFEVQRTL